MCPASDVARVTAAGPYGSAGIRSTSWNALEALAVSLVLLIPPYRRCAIPVLRPPHTLDSLTPADRSCDGGWSLINSTLGSKCPGHAGILVGERDDDGLGRLTREHPAQPRPGMYALALDPPN